MRARTVVIGCVVVALASALWGGVALAQTPMPTPTDVPADTATVAPPTETAAATATTPATATELPEATDTPMATAAPEPTEAATLPPTVTPTEVVSTTATVAVATQGPATATAIPTETVPATATPAPTEPPEPTVLPVLPADGGIPVEGGRFYSQAGGGTGRGFAISDLPVLGSDDPVTFFTAFQDFGGAFVIGYPATRRYLGDDGFIYQATQAALLQWRPELGTAVLANTFEMLSQAGVDDALLVRGIPKPMGDNAETFAEAKAIRFSWLTDEAIKAKYTAVGSLEQAMQIYGLPMSLPERHGPFIAQRFQRVTFQHWVVEVPGAPSAGSVTAVLGGDLLKEFGLLPVKAVQPHSLEESRAVAEQPVGTSPAVSPTATPEPEATATLAPGTTPSPTPTLAPGVTPSPTPSVTTRGEVRVQIGPKRFTIHGLIDEVGDNYIVIAGYNIRIDHKLVRRLQIKGSVDVGMFGKVEGVVLEDGTLAAEEVKAEAPKPGKGARDNHDDEVRQRAKQEREEAREQAKQEREEAREQAKQEREEAKEQAKKEREEAKEQKKEDGD